MSRLFFLITFAIFSLFAFRSLAQNITVINQYGDTTGLGKDAAFHLLKTQQHTLIINYYEPANKDEEHRLEQLIGSALNFYLDESVQIENGRVTFRKGKGTVLKGMNQIVKDAVKFYKYKEVADFSGFSQRIADKIEEIEHLDLNLKDSNEGIQQDEYQHYYAQKYLNELKLMAVTEIGNFSNDNLLVVGDTESVDPKKQSALLEKIENFQTHDLLEPISFDFPEARVTLLASDDEFLLPDYGVEGNKDDFAVKVLQMLENNNGKLVQLEGEMRALKKQQDEDHLTTQQFRDDQLQSQIDELRTLIVEFVADKRSNLPEIPHPAIANLPQSVEIIFYKGGKAIDTGARFVLNEVVDLLAHHPSIKIMVTGYADKTGNAHSNLIISQQRSRAVRNFIIQSGLSSERVIMNYFGDRASSGENPKDRKVVIEFLQY